MEPFLLIFTFQFILDQEYKTIHLLFLRRNRRANTINIAVNIIRKNSVSFIVIKVYNINLFNFH